MSAVDRPLRVASLVPAGTDLVCELGMGASLVGVSHECDHRDAAGLPVLTSGALPPTTAEGPGLDPQTIDRLVGEHLEAGAPLYRTDTERLRELAPDVIVTQDVCDVCALPSGQVRGDVPEGARLASLGATTVAGLEDDLRRLGEATGLAPARAEERIRRLRDGLAAATVPGAESLRVLLLEWGDPPFVGGHWVPELVEATGATHVLGGAGEASRRSDWAEIEAADPDLVVHVPCGYGLAAARDEATRLVRDTPLGGLRAAREGAVWAADANALFSRCTTNVADAAELLATLAGHVLRGGEPPQPPRAARVVEAAPARVSG